jgi:hypothetical protein
MTRILAALAAAAIALPAASWAQQQQQAPAASPAAAKAKVFSLASPDVKDGGKLPEKFGGVNPNVKGCTGQNISPELRWSNVPEGTKSFAIVMSDPVPRGGLGFVHWVAYDIPAKKTSLKQGEASKPSPDIKGGKAGAGNDVYFGPCPPFGDKPHPYVIVVIATDLEPGGLKAGMTREELGAALNGHVKGQTSIVARYGH